MKTNYNRTVILTVLLTGFLISCGNKSDAKLAGKEKEDNGEAMNVRIQEVRLTSFVDALQLTGVIKAYEDVKMSPEEGGVVKEWKVRKGQWVKKGTVLVILNDEVLKASADAAFAQYKIADVNYEKQAKVFSDQAISELQLKNAEYGRDAAKAQSDLAQARLERARLKSPIDGILNEEFHEEGEYAPPGMPLVHVVNVSRVKISAEIPEKFAGSVSLRTPVKIITDSELGDTLSGVISFVAAAVSPDNRTLPVEVVIPNKGLKLKPEMIVRVRILRSVQNQALLINENVIQLVDRNRTIVYVEKNGKAEERLIKTGGRQGKMVEILEGLTVGDQVITSGFQNLVNGQRVQVVGE